MTSKTNNSTKQLKPLFLKVSTNIDRKSNPVPSSLIFLSFLKHFSSIFFFNIYIFSTENASSISCLGRLKGEAVIFHILDLYGGVFRRSSGGSGESFSLRIPQRNRKRPKQVGVFRWNPLTNCCRSSRGRGRPFISPPSWTPWTSATQWTWGHKRFRQTRNIHPSKRIGPVITLQNV